MRRPMMAGNWKMNKTIDEAVILVESIRNGLGEIRRVDCVVCPSFICLPAVSSAASGSTLAVGVQNVHWADSGAFTGEVSAPMIKGMATHAIIGHSERRQYFGETDEMVNQRTLAALAHGLTPIVCVGESLEQNEAGKTMDVVSGQVTSALAHVDSSQVAGLIIAYEPIWAIGTGRAATAEQAGETCRAIRSACLASMFDETTAEQTRILYGGSTNDGNIRAIMEQPDIDGALIGGSALKADVYVAMVNITEDLYGS